MNINNNEIYFKNHLEEPYKKTILNKPLLENHFR